jgi:hypothetical protein
MLNPLADSSWGYSTAAHLFNRARFGASPENIEKLHRMGTMSLSRGSSTTTTFLTTRPLPTAQPDPSLVERFKETRAAAPLFLIGPKLNPGLLGQYPSLAPGDLNGGDLKYNVDFRSVYATVLEKWLKTSSTKILDRQFTSLPLGLA